MQPELQLQVQAVGEKLGSLEQFFPTGQQAGVLDLLHLTSCEQKQLVVFIPTCFFQEKPGITSVV